MAQLEVSHDDAPRRAWQFSLAQMLVTVGIASVLLVLGLQVGFWGVALGAIVVFGAWLLHVTIRDRWQVTILQLIASNTFVAILVGFGLSAGFLGLIVGVSYLLIALLYYVLTCYRRKIVRGILALALGANVITWAVAGSADETFLLLPYQGAAIFNLDFALICGDAARMEHASDRQRREAICPSVKHIYYEENVAFTFNQISLFGKWYEDQLNVPESKGLHFNVETVLHAPMFRVVREETLGRDLFGSGSDVLYVWCFNRWVRVYDDLRWFC
jgi:hypothetical protein